MGSCVSKKLAGRGGAGWKVAAPLPAERDGAPPSVVEEEVKEVLSETTLPRPRPPEQRPPRAPRKGGVDGEASEACSASESVSVVSTAAAEKAGGDQEVDQRSSAPAPEKAKVKRRAPEQTKDGNNKMRSASPGASSGSSRKQVAGGDQVARLRKEQAVVVSGIGCRSGRFSPSAARRAVDSAVRRTHSAREAEMMTTTAASRTPAKRSLNINGGPYSGASIRRDAGERSGRRSDSPTAKRAGANNNNTIQRQGSVGGGAQRKVTNGGNVDQMRQQNGGRVPREATDGWDAGAGEEAALGGGRAASKEEDAATLGQNPSVAMECFIFL